MKSGGGRITIRGFILTASVIVSLLFFGGAYWANSRVFDQSVKNNALHSADTLAQVTFNSMFQLMSTGWTRAQVREFIDSTRRVAAGASYSVEIYRGDVVARRFGSIEQAAPDSVVRQVFHVGQAVKLEQDDRIRYLFPLKAQALCLRCHVNAAVGDVLGVIDVKQDLTPLIRDARREYFVSLALLAPIPVVVALLVTVFVNRRIDNSLRLFGRRIAKINRVGDLKHLAFGPNDFGFAEINRLFGHIETLVGRLRNVVVDKDLLEFEIKLLEKFIITSDVVRDWHEYVNRLLADIGGVIDVHALFSIFRADDGRLSFDAFWRAVPGDAMKAEFETRMRQHLPHGAGAVTILHHVAGRTATMLERVPAAPGARVESLMLEAPKIGGIVGIGVYADLAEDDPRVLVLRSVLSTLLNVIGSVKAINKYTKELEYYATRDPLTKRYNQRVFWELLSYEIHRAERHRSRFAVLMIDIDNFKVINDSHGHGTGDQFLREFADCVHEALRAGDVLARYAGDEFAVILPETDLGEAGAVAQRILDRVGAMVVVAPDGTPVRGAASIGMGMYPDHATDAKDLFLFADNMMYKAKAHGKGRVGIPTDTDMVEHFRSIGEKSKMVLNAIEQRRVVPYFQPIVRAADGRLEAVEVLSRIRLEDGRILAAAELIEIAERAGVIHRLDYLVIELALGHARGRSYTGEIFINISPRAIAVAEFAPTLRRLVRDSGVAAEQIVFEITERDTIKNVATLAEFIAQLRADGFRFAVDDFGSGFSSFHYLKRFPIDYIKIEGEFVANAADAKDWAFVQSIASLADTLDIRTVAEHVESREVLERVTRAGIGYAQGYFIGAPLDHIPDQPT
jgi:diguanylate cyclase (GGDEF)-like protein